MEQFCKIDVASLTVVDGPAPLPPLLVGSLALADMADLSWTDPALGLHGVGYWPVSDIVTVDAEAGALTVDVAAKRVLRAVSAPMTPPAPPPSLAQKQFRDLWTFSERVKLDHPDLIDGLSVLQRAQIGTLMRDLSSASEIHLDHPDVVAGVEMVRGLGVISDARAAAILAGLAPA